MKGVVKMASNLGFTNGAVVNAKDADMQAAEGIFRIVKLSADTAEVNQVDGNITTRWPPKSCWRSGRCSRAK